MEWIVPVSPISEFANGFRTTRGTRFLRKSFSEIPSMKVRLVWTSPSIRSFACHASYSCRYFSCSSVYRNVESGKRLRYRLVKPGRLKL